MKTKIIKARTIDKVIDKCLVYTKTGKWSVKTPLYVGWLLDFRVELINKPAVWREQWND